MFAVWPACNRDGEGARLRAFHDAVLELDSVPLPVVRARIDRFITENGKGPYPDMERRGLGFLGKQTAESRRCH
jgi:hypothetical protein